MNKVWHSLVKQVAISLVEILPSCVEGSCRVLAGTGNTVSGLPASNVVRIRFGCLLIVH